MKTTLKKEIVGEDIWDALQRWNNISPLIAACSGLLWAKLLASQSADIRSRVYTYLTKNWSHFEQTSLRELLSFGMESGDPTFRLQTLKCIQHIYESEQPETGTDWVLVAI